MNAHRLSSLALILFAAFPVMSTAGAAEGAGGSERLTLNLQDRATVPGSTLEVHFVGYRDSRCPTDLQCVWAGEASAFFWLTGGGLKPQVVVVPWDGSGQPARYSKRVGPYRFYMRSLEPRPNHANKVGPGEYKAVLDITR